MQNARCLVKVKFSPKDSRIYEAKVPLILGGNTTQPYYMVDVRGEGQYPRLKFEPKECIMPPVPLGFASKAQFYVISQGYDNLQLKVWPSFPPHPLPQPPSPDTQIHIAAPDASLPSVKRASAYCCQRMSTGRVLDSSKGQYLL